MSDETENTDKKTPEQVAQEGGRARAEKLTPAQRKEIASKAAQARWAEGGAKIPKVWHSDRPIMIGDVAIPCAVLEDGRRVLMQEGVAEALGLKRKPGRSVVVEGSSQLPPFLDVNSLQAHIPKAFSAPLDPVQFKTKAGQRAFGYRAELLPDFCGIYVDAHDAGDLRANQKHIYDRAKILLRAFARVGIIALVDDATGHAAERDRDELQRILDAYIVEAMRPWVRTFPPEFFKQVARLQGWPFKDNMQSPRYVGKLINRYIYDRLPPGVHTELKERNPRVGARRKHKNFQFLTEETGIPHLDQQVRAVVMLMQAAENKGQFERMLQRVFPAPGDQQELAVASDNPMDSLKDSDDPTDD